MSVAPTLFAASWSKARPVAANDGSAGVRADPGSAGIDATGGGPDGTVVVVVVVVDVVVVVVEVVLVVVVVDVVVVVLVGGIVVGAPVVAAVAVVVTIAGSSWPKDASTRWPSLPHAASRGATAAMSANGLRRDGRAPATRLTLSISRRRWRAGQRDRMVTPEIPGAPYTWV